ncbi:MAG: exodeoxyribonuclease VII large subunit [Acidobacteriia bacterium]|nr:exodeoxyribonuclease VII large subunit [Terriglobia bacterium]
MPKHPLPTNNERKVLTVSEVTGRVKGLLEAEFASLWVEGEISNFTRAASGHLYFTLKDESAQLRCVCFRSQARSIRFNLEDGLKVLARGSLSVYERRGEYQFYVEVMEPVGIGALQLAFEQLKAKLQAEGLFDLARKQPLPLYPKTIGVVTSPTGAAIRDILRILKRRNEAVNVLIYPAKVQGDGASAEIAAGIEYLNTLAEVDVMIVGRGGGSIEDLWAFNEERVARAIAASKIPVISAVGHEIDFTISDFVADLRAPTPSAAAELVASAKDELLKHLSRLQEETMSALVLKLNRARQSLLQLTGRRGFALAQGALKEFRQIFDDLVYKLTQGERHLVLESRNRFQLVRNRIIFFDLSGPLRMARLNVQQRERQAATIVQKVLATLKSSLMVNSGKLDSLSPLKVLERGYAIVKNARGAVLKDSTQAPAGSMISVQLAKGNLEARVVSDATANRPRSEGSQGVLSFEPEG